jgi:hypothetical protein
MAMAKPRPTFVNAANASSEERNWCGACSFTQPGHDIFYSGSSGSCDRDGV